MLDAELGEWLRVAEVLVDTDVGLGHLAGVRRLPVRRARVGYSVITRVELTAAAGDERERDLIWRLLGAMSEYAVDRRVADQAGRIRREVGVRLPDALIAATALVHGLTVHTRNVRDFRRSRPPAAVEQHVQYPRQRGRRPDGRLPRRTGRERPEPSKITTLHPPGAPNRA